MVLRETKNMVCILLVCVGILLLGNQLMGTQRTKSLCFIDKYPLSCQQKKDIIQKNIIHNRNGPCFNHWFLYDKEKQFRLLSPYHIPMPETYLVRNGHIQGKISKQEGPWLVKPVDGYMARGIKIFSRVSQAQEFLLQHPHKRYIIQKHVFPHLIGGRKFDLRVYVLKVAIHGRIFIYVYQIFLYRFAPTPFKNSEVRYQQIFTTGCKIVTQKELKEPPQAWKKQVNDIVSQVGKSISLNRTCKDVEYNLYGYDFLVDQYQKIYLLEINTGPLIRRKLQWNMYKTMFNILLTLSRSKNVKEAEKIKTGIWEYIRTSGKST